MIDFSSGVARTDFDSPSSNTSTIGLNSPISLEGTTGPGDSGGPLFANFNGVSMIVGTLHGGINEIPGGGDSEYGDVSDWAALRNSQNLAFLATHGITPFAPTPGDFDGDGDIDGVDFLTWQQGLGGNPPNASDLALSQSGYGVPPSISSATVPEPSAFVLGSLAALLLAGHNSRFFGQR